MNRLKREALSLLVTLSECDEEEKQEFDHRGFGTESWVSLRIRLKELVKSISRE